MQIEIPLQVKGQFKSGNALKYYIDSTLKNENIFQSEWTDVLVYFQRKLF